TRQAALAPSLPGGISAMPKGGGRSWPPAFRYILPLAAAVVVVTILLGSLLGLLAIAANRGRDVSPTQPPVAQGSPGEGGRNDRPRRGRPPPGRPRRGSPSPRCRQPPALGRGRPVRSRNLTGRPRNGSPSAGRSQRLSPDRGRPSRPRNP